MNQEFIQLWNESRDVAAVHGWDSDEYLDAAARASAALKPAPGQPTPAPAPVGTIGHLIRSLNEKTRAAGEDLTVRHATFDRTWGDAEGVLISGSGDRARAIAYIRAYYAKHLAPKRSYSAQYTFQDLGRDARGRDRVKLVYWPCE